MNLSDTVNIKTEINTCFISIFQTLRKRLVIGELLISKKSANNEKDVHISPDLKFYKNKPRDFEKIIMIAGRLVILKYLNRSKVQI